MKRGSAMMSAMMGKPVIGEVSTSSSTSKTRTRKKFGGGTVTVEKTKVNDNSPLTANRTKITSRTVKDSGGYTKTTNKTKVLDKNPYNPTLAKSKSVINKDKRGQITSESNKSSKKNVLRFENNPFYKEYDKKKAYRDAEDKQIEAQNELQREKRRKESKEYIKNLGR